jgi:hypothetical protein
MSGFCGCFFSGADGKKFYWWKYLYAKVKLCVELCGRGKKFLFLQSGSPTCHCIEVCFSVMR